MTVGVNLKSGRALLLPAVTLLLLYLFCHRPLQGKAAAGFLGAAGRNYTDSFDLRDAAPNPPPAGVPPQSSCGIAGTVSDTHGARLPGIRVTLVAPNETQSSVSHSANRVAMTDSQGTFSFTDLAPGTYRVRVDGVAVEPVVSGDISLVAGEVRKLPMTVIIIERKTTTVNVVATTKQVAQAQVHQQEKQRVLGIMPNFLTSYIWDAAPMTRKLKYKLAVRSAIDPVTFLVAAAVAGAEQEHNTFPGYGRGGEGYAKRYGATIADTMASRMISFAILPSLFHQDPRYFYRGSGSTRSRTLYALKAAVICRGDNGHSQLNYSKILGSFAAAGLSNIYRDPQDRQASLTFRNGLIIIGSGAVANLLREFISRKLTHNVPAFANGKP